MRKLTYILFVLLSCLSVQALIAYDDASDIVYSDGWDNMDNGGNGFGAWVMNNGLMFKVITLEFQAQLIMTVYHQRII